MKRLKDGISYYFSSEFIFGLVSIIALLFAVYTWIEGDFQHDLVMGDAGEPRYVYRNLDLGRKSGVYIMRGNKVAKNDIMRSVFWLWSKSSRTIRESSIRDSIRVYIRGVDEVIDYETVKQTNQSRDSIDIKRVLLVPQDSLAIVEIDFKQLSPGSSAVFQITAIGDSLSRPIFEGDIAGVDDIGVQRYGTFHFRYSPDTLFGNFLFAYIIIFACILFVMLLFKIGHYVTGVTVDYIGIKGAKKQRFIRNISVFLISPIFILLLSYAIAESAFWVIIKPYIEHTFADYPPVLDEWVRESVKRTK